MILKSLQPHTSYLPFSPPRSITKTVVNSEIRKEISENQKVHFSLSFHLFVFSSNHPLNPLQQLNFLFSFFCPLVRDSLGLAVYQYNPMKGTNKEKQIEYIIAHNHNPPASYLSSGKYLKLKTALPVFVLFLSPFYYVINCKQHLTWKAFSFWQCVGLLCSVNGIGNRPFFLSNIFSRLLIPLLKLCSHYLGVQTGIWVGGWGEQQSPNYWIGDSFGRHTESCSKKWLLIEVVWTHALVLHADIFLSLSHTHINKHTHTHSHTMFKWDEQYLC